MDNSTMIGTWIWWAIIVMFNLVQLSICLYYVVLHSQSSASKDMAE
jgi:hypothetical protein